MTTASSVYDFHVEALHSFLNASAIGPSLPTLPPPAEWLVALHVMAQEIPVPSSYAHNQLATRVLSIPLAYEGLRIGPTELFQFICNQASRYRLCTLDVLVSFTLFAPSTLSSL